MSFQLLDQDLVFVRLHPGYVGARTVAVEGQVLFPGGYAMFSRHERVSSLIGRAGGLTSDAYVPGARLMRGDVAVALDLPGALQRPGGEHDLALSPGDRLVVPSYDPTVFVSGAVAREVFIPYESGLSMSDYIYRAGGAAEGANLDRAFVGYQNGELATTGKFLFWRLDPDIRPGSVIRVPARPPGEGGFNWDSFLTKMLAVISVMSTVIIAVDR